MRRLLALITGLLLVVTVGCGSSGSKSSSSSSTSSSSSKSSSSSSSSAATTTTTSTTTTTTLPATTAAPPTTAGPVNGASTPELAAQGLYDRWVAGDPAGARSFAEDGVIATLFANSGAGAHYTFQLCDGAAGTFHCQFSYEGGAADFQVHNEAIIGDGSLTGFKVFNIQYTAD